MMRKSTVISLLAGAALVLTGPMGCNVNVGNSGGNANNNGNANGNGNDNANGNDNGNVNTNGDVNTNGGNVDTNGNDNSNGVTLTAIKTNIDVHNGGRIAVGDDLLVYGYGGFAGVDYIIPSAGDTAGRDLPNGDTYVAKAFAVSGKKIALVSNFIVTIFDTQTETATTIPEADIRLVNTPVGLQDQGHITADGNYIACRTDSGTNNGSKIKVIDVSGDTPQVIDFSTSPDGTVDHIAVDGDAQKIAAASGDTFYIYDITDPTAAPMTFDTTANGGIGDKIFTFDGGYILYEDNEASGRAWFLNTADGMGGTFTMLTANPTAGEQCSDGGRFAYFVDRDANDTNGNDARSGVGTVPGPGATLAGDTEIDGSTTNNGFVGWSQLCAITPDGAYTFLSGRTSIGSGEFLQVYNGGWSLVADPDNSSPYGLPATDVAVSNSLVGFKTGDGTTAGTSTKVGYIILN